MELFSQMLGASGGNVPSWVWVWLSNLIGSDNAAVVQYILMIFIYALTIGLCIWQVVRIMGAAHDRNHKDIRIREEAKDRMRSGIIIIAVVIVIGAIGFSSVCFFLNKFMGV
ncbi:MAG: hypothetical protein LBS76_02540 [Mycoplasmataceae bacterium]|nr:hypothetical protein [Mycoplasmataceae bacterium]